MTAINSLNFHQRDCGFRFAKRLLVCDEGAIINPRRVCDIVLHRAIQSIAGAVLLGVLKAICLKRLCNILGCRQTTVLICHVECPHFTNAISGYR